jgi:hypothetical protein
VPKVERIPLAQPLPPSPGTGTSYTDFDPREPLPAPKDSRIEKLEGGTRIKGEVEEGFGRRGRKARVI